MLKIILLVLQIVAAILIIFPLAARAVEAIYQLSQTPNLNTISKIWQTVKNFFTIEKYQVK